VYRYDFHPTVLTPHVFVVAEIGSNWLVGSPSQNLEMASWLIDAAKEAKVDAVKFQTFRSEKVYAMNAGVSRYLSQQGLSRDIHEVFHDLEMSYDDIPCLAGLAKKAGLAFMSTPFSPEDFAAVDPYVSYHKIASYEIAFKPLLLLAAQSKKPVFLSTGASFFKEISWAVQTLREAGCRDLTILQCTAAYPALPHMMNIRAMNWLSKTFSCPVGLSDHSMDYDVAPLLAVAYGAKVIEKHITWDRTLPGPDHAFALEPHELRLFVEKVRLAEAMVGSGFKGVTSQEDELFHFAKRSLQAICPILVGDVIQEGKNIAILRPGNNIKGAHPALLPCIEGKKAKRSLLGGEGIHIEDVV
jgi:sialic acid synthase SpsE